MRGATVVVHRGGDVLVLRRVEHHENGDWQWTPPSGMAEPGESPAECAARELREETSLELPLRLVRDGEWALFVAEAAHDAVVALSGEHDAYAWIPLDEACARCTPAIVGDGVREALG